MDVQTVALQDAMAEVEQVAAEEAETHEDKQDKFWRMNSKRALFRKAAKAFDAAGKAAAKVSP